MLDFSIRSPPCWSHFVSPTLTAMVLQLLDRTFKKKHSNKNIQKTTLQRSIQILSLPRVEKMTLMYVGKIKSRVNGHHCSEYKYTVREELECITELENEQSNHTVSVNAKKNKTERTKNQ